jgi:hypothetical protein
MPIFWDINLVLKSMPLTAGRQKRTPHRGGGVFRKHLIATYQSSLAMFKSSASIWSLCDPVGLPWVTCTDIPEILWFTRCFLQFARNTPSSPQPTLFTPQLITNSSPLTMVDVKPRFRNHDKTFPVQWLFGLATRGLVIVRLNVVHNETGLSRETKHSRLNSTTKNRVDSRFSDITQQLKILRLINCVECHVHEDSYSSVLFPWNDNMKFLLICILLLSHSFMFFRFYLYICIYIRLYFCLTFWHRSFTFKF